MIDYLSLALGHGLLAVALLRLVMREELDVDPRLKEIADKAEAEHGASTNAGRAARRRAGESRKNPSVPEGPSSAKGDAS